MKHPELIHRVQHVFGALVNTAVKLYKDDPSLKWRELDAIHMIVNHRDYRKFVFMPRMIKVLAHHSSAMSNGKQLNKFVIFDLQWTPSTKTFRCSTKRLSRITRIRSPSWPGRSWMRSLFSDDSVYQSLLPFEHWSHAIFGTS